MMEGSDDRGEPVKKRPRGRPRKSEMLKTQETLKSEEAVKTISHNVEDKTQNEAPGSKQTPISSEATPQPKRPRGRPRLTPKPVESEARSSCGKILASESKIDLAHGPQKRPRGRPRKSETVQTPNNSDGIKAIAKPTPVSTSAEQKTNSDKITTPASERTLETPKRSRGRPRKSETVQPANREKSNQEASPDVNSMEVFASPSKQGGVSSRGRKTTRFNLTSSDLHIESMMKTPPQEPHSKQSTDTLQAGVKKTEEKSTMKASMMNKEKETPAEPRITDKLQSKVEETIIEKCRLFDDVADLQHVMDTAEQYTVMRDVTHSQRSLSHVRQLSDVEMDHTSSDLYLCPLCPVNEGQTAWHIRSHVILRHWNKRFSFPGGLNVLRCSLHCDEGRCHGAGDSHYHCPTCPTTVSTAPCFQRHLRLHQMTSRVMTDDLEEIVTSEDESEGQRDEMDMTADVGVDKAELDKTSEDLALMVQVTSENNIEESNKASVCQEANIESVASDIVPAQDGCSLAVTSPVTFHSLDDYMTELLHMTDVYSPVLPKKLRTIKGQHASHITNFEELVVPASTTLPGTTHPQYHCPLCPVVNGDDGLSGRRLQSHFIRVHWHKRFALQDLFILRCALLCGQPSENNHIKTANQNTRHTHYHCPLCDQLYITSDQLENHILSHRFKKTPRAPKVDVLLSYSVWCWRRTIKDEVPTDEPQDFSDDSSVIHGHNYLKLLGGDKLALASMGNRELTILSRLSSETLDYEELLSDARRLAERWKRAPPVSNGEMGRSAWSKMVDSMPGQHFSYVKNLSDVEVLRCTSCCDLFHCPLCAREETPGCKPAQLRTHLLRVHWNKRFVFGEVSLLRCNRSCPIINSEKKRVLTAESNISYNSHYHCPLCTQIKSTVKKFREHMRSHVTGTSHEAPVQKVPATQLEARLQSFMQTGQDLPEEVLKRLQRQGVEDEQGQGHYEGRGQGHSEGRGHEGLGLNEGQSYDGQSRDEGQGLEGHDEGQGQVQVIAEIDDEVKEEDDEEGENSVGNNRKRKPEDMSSPSGPVAKKAKGALRTVAAMVDLQVLERLPTTALEFAAEVDKFSGLSCSLLDIGEGMVQGLVQGTLDQIQRLGDLMEALEQQLPSSLDELQLLINSHLANQQVSQGIKEEGAKNEENKDIESSVQAENQTECIEQQYTVIFDKDGNATIEYTPQAEPERSEDVGEELNIEMTQDAGVETGKGVKESEDDVSILDRKKKRLQCPLCDKRFRAMWSLLPHFAKAHPESSSDQGSNDETELLKTVRGYIAEMNKLNEPQCPRCGKNFKHLQEAKLHFALKTCDKRPTIFVDSDLRINPANNMYMCPMCDEYESHKSARVIDHMARIHAEKTLPCKVCEKMFSNEKLLKLHMKLNHVYAKKMAVCDLCGVEIVASYLQKHKQLMHDSTYVKPKTPRSKYIPCKECSYMAPRRCALFKHVLRKHRERNFHCELCPQKFATAYDLKIHVDYIHMKDKDNDPRHALVSCQECGKSIKQKHLDTHIKRVHKKERQFVCTVCDKAFSSKHSRQIHMMSIHTKPEDRQYKFKCDICSAGFFNKRIYTDHLNIHSGDKPYKCEICFKSFRLNQIYRNHMQTHQPERFACEVCSLVCTSKGALYSHMLTHPAWECVCGLSFLTKAQLEIHMKNEECQSIRDSSKVAVKTEDGSQPSFVIYEQEGGQEIEGEQTVLVLKTDGAIDSQTQLEEYSDPQNMVSVQGEDNVVQLYNLANVAEEVPTQETVSIENLVYEVQDGTDSSQATTITTEDGEQILLENPNQHETVQIVQQIEGDNQELIPLTQALETLLEPGSEGVQLEDGVVEVGEAGVFMCGYCQGVYPDLNSVQQHMMTEHVETLVKAED